jgi:hypothetical protein
MADDLVAPMQRSLAALDDWLRAGRRTDGMPP